MISSVEDLYNLEINPRINDISLSLLAKFYTHYLHSYIYRYKIIDSSDKGNNETFIELRFDTDNFCHLLSIEKIVKHTKNNEEIKQFKSKDGWNNVKDGVITIPSLRVKRTKGKFDSNKDKYVFFYLIPKLVEKPKAVIFNQEDVIGNPTNVDCEILFYDEYQKANIHLGIKKDGNLGYYIPQTFLIERITKSKDGQRFVANQQKILVEKIDKNIIE